ncbi:MULTISPECIES: HAD family hydrolase [unclassified Leifsonia]|uniref:HAD family hydrolase n=1 Tax=unclassified Leifsonia TaxID=2663824 RepID=UPI0006F887D8|nr:MULTISPECIES: HAD family hydrolase [unclassified Leifsonia]KQX05329.1 acid phosphatase [Leifsonia sp. Root1293]KRA08961.1 acid phosphatase [Leifsonia sp. Root60]
MAEAARGRTSAAASTAGTALPSWRDTTTRTTIIDFVERVTGDTPDAVAPEERIAVFDNDGTLWTEKPMPTQLHYLVERWTAAATADPSLVARQPYAAVASGDLSWIGTAVDKHYTGDDSGLQSLVEAIIAATADESVEDYAASVSEFYRNALHPVLQRTYATVVYAPMVELLAYLEANGFTCYIVSGGDRDFMRPMTADSYGIPPERVIGSAVGLVYDEKTNAVRYGTSLDFLDDGPVKPVRIWSRIGRRPILAAGNSNGDIPMLRFASGSASSLALLVHHDDDAGRGDVAYDEGAEQALAAASDAASGITVVSVKDDWSRIFPDAAGQNP